MGKFFNKLSRCDIFREVKHARYAEIPSRGLKFFTLSFLFVSIPGAFGSWLDPDAYGAQIYEKVIFNVLPWWTWSLFWTITTVLIIIHNIKSNYLAYLLANIFVIFLSVSYALMFTYGKIVSDFPLTYMSVGIWISIASTATAAILADVPIMWHARK